MEEAAAQASEALEQAQRVQVGGLALFGHPNQIYNGIYLWVNGRVHEGWPWYKHERSIARLYRCTSDARRQWNLNTKLKPEVRDNRGYIRSFGGPVPVGKRKWRAFSVDGPWDSFTFSVVELVSCSSAMTVIVGCPAKEIFIGLPLLLLLLLVVMVLLQTTMDQVREYRARQMLIAARDGHADTLEWLIQPLKACQSGPEADANSSDDDWDGVNGGGVNVNALVLTIDDDPFNPGQKIRVR